MICVVNLRNTRNPGELLHGEKMAVACGGLGRLATKATWFLTLTLQEDIQEKAVMHKGRKYVFAPLCGLTCRY